VPRYRPRRSGPDGAARQCPATAAHCPDRVPLPPGRWRRHATSIAGRSSFRSLLGEDSTARGAWLGWTSEYRELHHSFNGRQPQSFRELKPLGEMPIRNRTAHRRAAVLPRRRLRFVPSNGPRLASILMNATKRKRGSAAATPLKRTGAGERPAAAVVIALASHCTVKD